MTDENTVFDRFRRTALRWPDRCFMTVLPETAEAYGIAAGDWKYGAALSEIEALAARYSNAGYGRGARVGLLLENRPDFLRHWLALNACGTGIVPINPDLRSAERAFLAENSGMVAAVSVPDAARSLAADTGVPVFEVNDAPPCLPRIGGDSGTESGDAECALLYTSGTTGPPKGCRLGNAYFLATGAWYAGNDGHIALREEPQERMLTPLPLFHVNALAFSVMAVIEVGGCLTVLDRFHPSTWWDSVRACDASVIHYLGIMPPLLLKAEPCASDRAHGIRFGFGAGMPSQLHAEAERRFGFPFVEGWAMTETGAGGIIMATEGDRKPGTACFGRPRDHVAARVVLEDGSEAPADVPGELLVCRNGADPRAGFFSGYLKLPDETEKAWEGGWLHTGDIVTRDRDGDLHFVDRKKNVVRRSGENISSAEVENILGRHPAIRSVAVGPVEDAIRGEEVFALIVLNNGSDNFSAGRLAVWAREEMAYYKVPGWIGFANALPLTATEKVQRSTLRDIASAMIADGTAADLRPMKRRQ
ncbi:MAG: AMP-binding protein [Pseudomonadota bacterium]